MPERAVDILSVNPARFRPKRYPAAEFLAEHLNEITNSASITSQSSSRVTLRIRAAAHQGRNDGYSETSATSSYICRAVYGRILVSEWLGIPDFTGLTRATHFILLPPDCKGDAAWETDPTSSTG